MEAVVKVGFSAGQTIVGRAVRYLTKGEVSHTFFYVKDARGELAYEASTRGFRRLCWREFQVQNRVLSLVDVEWPHEEVRDRLELMVGTPYPVYRLLWFGLLLLFKKRPVRQVADDVMDCVESVVRVMAQFGLNVVLPLSPEELRTQLRKP